MSIELTVKVTLRVMFGDPNLDEQITLHEGFFRFDDGEFIGMEPLQSPPNDPISEGEFPMKRTEP